MSSFSTVARAGLALVAGTALAVGLAATASAQFSRGGDGGRSSIDPRTDRSTVSIRIVPVGDFCVRAVGAVGYDPRANQRLYNVGFDSGPMTSLGVTAFENAFSGARTQGDAMRALSAARHDAQPYRRSAADC